MAWALDPTELPDDVAVLKAMLLAADTRVNDTHAEIANLKLTIAKIQRDRFGAKSERGTKLLDQLELRLAELEEAQVQNAVTGELELSSTDVKVDCPNPARRPLPEHLPRERQVHAGPSACPDCVGRLRKLGEDITETLEYVPATWKVIRYVREKFSCRGFERISQAPAPNHPIARGRAGPIFWHRCCSTSAAPTCRSNARVRSSPVMT